MERYRIENIQKATLNGKKVKLFRAFQYVEEQHAYLFCGQFSAPQNTPDNKLINFIEND